jgi:hypothetical protein
MESLKRLDAAAEGRSTMEDKKKLDDAGSRVSSFLSESRILAERATLCAHSGCAFLCTGLTPKYCCRLCAKTPGTHGPKCQKKLLPCSTPGCTFAVTRLGEKYCCKMCQREKVAWTKESHGPQCWCLPMEEKCEAAEEEEEAATEPQSSGASNSEELELVGHDTEGQTDRGSGSELRPSLSLRSSPATASSDRPSYDISDEKENAVSDQMIDALSAKIKGNEMALMANEAVIRALRQALAS